MCSPCIGGSNRSWGLTIVFLVGTLCSGGLILSPRNQRHRPTPLSGGDRKALKKELNRSNEQRGTLLLQVLPTLVSSTSANIIYFCPRVAEALTVQARSAVAIPKIWGLNLPLTG